MIGIIVADIHEKTPLPWQLVTSGRLQQFPYEIYQHDSMQIVRLHSGIGLVNAAAATQAMISKWNIKLICNYGAVGAYGGPRVYDVIAPRHIYFHDVVTPWYAYGQTPGEPAFFTNDISSVDQCFNLASGGSFLSNARAVRVIRRHLDVYLFDMEAAAIAQIAQQSGVPLWVVKCVSDVVGTKIKGLEDINTRVKKAGVKALEALVSALLRHDAK